MYKLWSWRRLRLVHLAVIQLLLLLTVLLAYLGGRPGPEEAASAAGASEKGLELPTISTGPAYRNFNTSVCFAEGTDVGAMARDAGARWKCNCLPGWHGKDCAQPEVVWRAFSTARQQKTLSATPRKHFRRLIYIIWPDDTSSDLADILINELAPVVDVFVLWNSRARQRGAEMRKLGRKVLRVQASLGELLRSVQSSLRGLRPDDLLLLAESHLVPSRRALQYFKLYDDWPRLFNARVKWNVYGYFWQHPAQTKTVTVGAALGYVADSLAGDLSLLRRNSSQNADPNAITFGDLNHPGGWLCEYCNNPNELIENLALNLTQDLVDWRNTARHTLDAGAVEDYIENGLYLDGVTALQRVHRSREAHYAPDYLTDAEDKYYWLMNNIYTKLDY